MVDLSTLRKLMSNDENMVQQFLQIFKSQTPQQMEQLRKYITNENWEYISLTAHAIKSQAKYLGLEEMVEHAFAIEKSAENKEDMARISDRFGVLENKLNIVLGSEVFK